MSVLEFFAIRFIIAFTILVGSGTVPKPIIARYNELTKVIGKQDFKKFSEFFAEEFVSVSPNGTKTNRKEFLESVKVMFKESMKVDAQEKLLKATTHDGIVDVSFDFTMKVNGKGGGQVVHEVGIDSWKKVGSKWLLVKTVDKKFEVKPLVNEKSTVKVKGKG